jgi:hypothetical protein
MPDKPDPARAWKYAMKLLAEEELQRLDKMSDEDVEDEMRAQGRDPARVPSAEELLTKATARAAKKVGTGHQTRVAPLARARRSRGTMWLVAATLAAVVIAVVAMNGAAIVALFKGNGDIRADDAGRMWRNEIAHRQADKLRDDAENACQLRLWGACESSLDEAMKQDPAGESEERVERMRKMVDEAARAEAGPDGKKRVP